MGLGARMAFRWPVEGQLGVKMVLRWALVPELLSDSLLRVILGGRGLWCQNGSEMVSTG